MKAAAFAMMLGLAACTSTFEPLDGADPALLPGGSWRLERIATDPGGDGVPVAVQLSAGFSADGQVGGMAGPNSYGGSYSASASGVIQVSNVTSTLIGGEEAERAFEYLQHMTRVRSFTVTQDELRLQFSDRGVLIFRRMTIGPH